MLTTLDNAPEARSSPGPAVMHRRTAWPRSGRPGWAKGRWVILEADDLGLAYAFNEGIRQAHLDGYLTSTCLRANGYAYDHAVTGVLPACPRLGVGVHLCLNEGRCVAPAGEVSHLIACGQQLRRGYLWLIRLARSSAGRLQIEREFRAQIERILSDGVSVDHLNSHQHVHMIPRIFRLTCRLAAEYGIPCVRLAREPAYLAPGLVRRIAPLTSANYVKHLLLNRFAGVDAAAAREYGLRTTDHFVGVNYTGQMDLGAIAAGLEAAGGGSVEILLHPTTGPDRRDVAYAAGYLRGYVAAPRRAVEHKTLTSPALAAWLGSRNWKTASFADWAEQQELDLLPETTPQVPERVRRLCSTLPVTNPAWVSAALPDARAFVQLAITQVRPGRRVLDLGTGTGICAICLAKLGQQVVAADLSAAAVRCANGNAARNGVSFECYRSDLLESVEGRFDLIVFNLPYNIARDTWAANLAKNLLRRVSWIRRNSGCSMPTAVRRFHQRLVRRLMDQVRDCLNPGGEVLLHVFESEVGDLIEVLPPGVDLRILRHPDLAASGSVGLGIRIPHSYPI